jgi:hypothetical protein
MARRFERGDHVSWNSEAGRVRGRITRVVTAPIEFKGYTVHAAMHKGSALTRLQR